MEEFINELVRIFSHNFGFLNSLEKSDSTNPHVIELKNKIKETISQQNTQSSIIEKASALKRKTIHETTEKSKRDNEEYMGKITSIMNK